MQCPYNWWSTINYDKDIVNALNMIEEIRGYTVGFVFEHVEIQIEYIDYLILVHGTKSNRTLSSGVISQ